MRGTLPSNSHTVCSLSTSFRLYHADLAIARSDNFYLISPGLGSKPVTLGREMVPGALAVVKWVEAFVGPYFQDASIRVWKAVPPTDDYVAMGIVAMTRTSLGDIPAQPPAALADRFRAVHKRALTGASLGPTAIYKSSGTRVVYAVDNRYWYADMELPLKSDCYALDPKMTVSDWSGW